MMPAWIATLIKLMREHVPREFVGQIEVNVFKGGISNVNVKQSFKQEDTTK
jgi:hypothetical protein